MTQIRMKVAGTDGSDFLTIASLDPPDAEVIEVNLFGGDDNVTFDSGLAAAEVSGGFGDDIVIGTEFDDVLMGNSGNDILFGGAGNDEISGGSDTDVIAGGAGDDVLRGGTDDDRLIGGDGDDALFGNSGDDFLDGGAGNDTIRGGAGDDTIRANGGVDVAYGDDGADIFHLDDDDGFIPGVVFVIGDFLPDEDKIDVTDLQQGSGATEFALDSNADGLLNGTDSQITEFAGMLILNLAPQAGGVLLIEDLASLSVSDVLFAV